MFNFEKIKSFIRQAIEKNYYSKQILASFANCKIVEIEIVENKENFTVLDVCGSGKPSSA